MQTKILGIGVYRQGKYASSEYISVNKWAPTWQYRLWHNMIHRCYSETRKGRASYEDCIVHEEFLDFQNFMVWCEKQVGFGELTFQLDKDVLRNDNRVYSPYDCVFLPQELNATLIQCRRKVRDNPLGVSYEEWTWRYKAQIAVNKRNLNLGRYDSPELAFSAYKIAKEDHIKQQANKWQAKIDPRAYQALMEYEVLITD
jgi:hypothetical protein